MKKIAIIKKKEVLLGILAIFFMIVGFISYNPIANKEYSKIADVTNYSETKLGEATLVSSNEVVENVADENQTSENTGFEDVVIFKNSDSVSVVVKSDVLLPEQVAQIQNIVEREFKINGKNINITNK